MNAQKWGYFKKQFSNLFESGSQEYIFGNTAEVMKNCWKWFSLDSSTILYSNNVKEEL